MNKLVLQEINGSLDKFLLQLEYWEGNTYYGIARIIKKYAGLPFWIPFNFHVQHGLVFFSFLGIDKCKENLNYYNLDRDCQFLIFNPDYVPELIKNGYININAIGAPIIYLDEFINKVNLKTNKKRGTIAFPQKSTHHVDSLTDYHEYAEMLTKLPSKFHPIAVCMYYLDIKKGHDKAFRDKGMKVFSNGFLMSKNFLHNFVINVSPYEYATSNNPFASAGYYAIFLGLKYFVFGPDINFKVSPRLQEHRYTRELMADLKNAYQKDNYILGENSKLYNFPIEQCENYEFQKEIAFRELGVHAKLSRQEMRQMVLGAIDAKFFKKYARTVLNRFKFGKQMLSAYRIMSFKLKTKN